MKTLFATALASCLTVQTLAGSVAWKDNSPRAIDDLSLEKRMAKVNTLPLVAPLCNGYSVAVTGIDSSVNQGANLMGNNVQKGKNDYPHPFRNIASGTTNLFTWADCPAGAGAWYEFPVLRNSPNPWLPGSTTKLGPTEPDRAIFQANSATEVTFCGMITHSGAPALGQFIQCT